MGVRIGSSNQPITNSKKRPIYSSLFSASFFVMIMQTIMELPILTERLGCCVITSVISKKSRIAKKGESCVETSPEQCSKKIYPIILEATQ
jgi:hypothetical protein